ncbi:MAG: hypothetical protein Q9219_003784 [cf. Caloplaca sp. 3 TL-2023]
MAPALKVFVQWLPSLAIPTSRPAAADSARLPSTHTEPIVHARTEPIVYGHMSNAGHQQQHALGSKTDNADENLHVSAVSPYTLSTVSWGVNRVDAFGLTGNNVSHKFWDGYQWNPENGGLETLGNGLATPPVAVTWGADRLDIFGLDNNNVIKHQYWDSVAWRPQSDQFENLGGTCDPKQALAADTWAPNRLDIFCRGPDGDLRHQYYDGSQWQPDMGSTESLGGSIASGPKVVSWGINRLDIFALNGEGDVTHKYWDGYQWSSWETFPASLKFRKDSLSVSTWGEDRLDIYAVAKDTAGTLFHKFWDGYQWNSWESLGSPDTAIVGSVGATSWAPDRIDIVGRVASTGNYWYKFYDGTSWQPSVTGWYDKGPGLAGKPFYSDPAVVSWGANRLDIFGTWSGGQLLHQTWTGENWYPNAESWECLGGCSSNLEYPEQKASKKASKEEFFEVELR